MRKDAQPQDGHEITYFSGANYSRSRATHYQWRAGQGVSRLWLRSNNRESLMRILSGPDVLWFSRIADKNVESHGATQRQRVGTLRTLTSHLLIGGDQMSFLTSVSCATSSQSSLAFVCSCSAVAAAAKQLRRLRDSEMTYFSALSRNRNSRSSNRWNRSTGLSEADGSSKDSWI